MLMHEILDYCTGGTTRHISGGNLIVREGGKSGHLFILIEGRLEVIKGDSVVAVLTEPGAVFGEMSVLLNRPHSASVRAASDSVVYELDDAIIFLREQPAVVLLIAQLLAQRLNVATTYLADLMHQYASATFLWHGGCTRCAPTVAPG
jgi:CRP-like cAMP-binding protein